MSQYQPMLESLRDAYWTEKDIGEVIRIGTRALEAAAVETDPTDLSVLKAIAYDVASFTWPGWGEDEVVLTEDAMNLGLLAAEINLALAERLGKAPMAVSMALWMLGAHLLGQGSLVAAKEAFRSAAEVATEGGHQDLALLYRGYGVVVECLEDEAAAARLLSIKSELAGFPDGPAYSEQLDVALSVFESRSPPG